MEGDIYEYTKMYYPHSWRDFFTSRMKMIQSISEVIGKDVKEGYTVLPKMDFLWNAFIHTGFDNVKVVILGQDPYQNVNDAMGLAFSVDRYREDDIPPSLGNIFKVMKKTVSNFEIPDHGDLSDWAVQGVLLINTASTVIQGKKNSHSRPWAQFTNALMEYLSEYKSNLVFMLWGNEAKGMKKYIDGRKHLVLMTSHPSPFSFERGFNESDHFNKANEYLKSHGKEEINWNLN